LRNAAIVLGNQRPAAALGALARGLRDEEPLVRGACAWALGQYEDPTASELLRTAATTEGDPEVQAEIEEALHRRTTSVDAPGDSQRSLANAGSNGSSSH
jgi:epoxyqueuosine reductase